MIEKFMLEETLIISVLISITCVKIETDGRIWKVWLFKHFTWGARHVGACWVTWAGKFGDIGRIQSWWVWQECHAGGPYRDTLHFTLSLSGQDSVKLSTRPTRIALLPDEGVVSRQAHMLDNMYKHLVSCNGQWDLEVSRFLLFSADRVG